MDISNVLKFRNQLEIYVFVSFIKRETHKFDRNDFLAKFLQHVYGSNVKMHFVELLIYDDGWTINFPKLLLLHRE